MDHCETEHWWTEIDREIVDLLARRPAMAPHDIARELRLSDGEVTALLCMLAREGRVQIRLVELAGPERLARHPAAA